MKRSTVKFKVEFVNQVPVKMKARTLYVSIPFATAMHLCPCGCKSEIVTKIAPHRWQMLYDGETISLDPSIGNWTLPCRSHYWFIENNIIWAASWSDEKVKEETEKDKIPKKGLFRKWFFE